MTAAGLAGGAVMMLEILGGRLLAPYFGYSIYQWGALIGVVMAALAVGYWLGGQVGDRASGVQWLIAALAAACLATLLVPWSAPMLLPHLVGLGAAWGPVAATSLLIAPSCLLLAITGPVLIGAVTRTRAAAVAGRVYAVSTVGSIVGTFLTAFWAIPEIGTRASLLVAAGLVALAAGLVGWASQRRVATAFIALPLLATLVMPSGRSADAAYAAESPHNQIEVVDSADERLLYLNYRTGFQSILVKGKLLTDAAHDQFLLLPLFAPTKRVLFLGAAGGVSLNQLLKVYPAVSLVGVELDPAVLQVAHQWFNLTESPRLKLIADDARRYLATSNEQFDAVALDLYVTGQIPPHCITVEFFREVRARLGANGVVMLNVVARHDPELLVQPLAATLGRVFPTVFRYAPRNQMLIATAQATTAEALIRRLRGLDVPLEIRPLAEAAARNLVPVAPPRSTPVFTDDKSDIEFRSFRVVHGRN